MLKPIYVAIGIFFLILPVMSQTDWPVPIGEVVSPFPSSPASVNSTGITEEGNIFVIGQFSGIERVGHRVDGSEVHIVSPFPDGTKATFLVRYDSKGFVDWAHYFMLIPTGIGWDNIGIDLALDDVNEKLYITGTIEHASQPNSHAWVAQFNYDGDLLHQTIFSGTGSFRARSNSIAIGDDGLPVITGEFTNNLVFPSNYYEETGFEPSSNGASDMFVAKWYPEGNDQWVWAMKCGGSSDDTGNDVAIDPYDPGNIFVTGSFTDSADFKGIPLDSSGNSDIFALSLQDNSKSLIDQITYNQHEVNRLDNLSAELQTRGDESYGHWGCSSIEIWLCTVFPWSCTCPWILDPETENQLTEIENDLDELQGEIVSLKAELGNGPVVAWASQAGGIAGDHGSGIAVAPEGVYITGDFTDAAMFGTVSHETHGGTAAFVSQLDNQTGDWQWTSLIKGDLSTQGKDIDVDFLSVYVTGQMGGTTVFSDGVAGKAQMEITLEGTNSEDAAAKRVEIGGINDLIDDENGLIDDKIDEIDDKNAEIAAKVLEKEPFDTQIVALGDAKDDLDPLLDPPYTDLLAAINLLLDGSTPPTTFQARIAALKIDIPINANYDQLATELLAAIDVADGDAPDYVAGNGLNEQSDTLQGDLDDLNDELGVLDGELDVLETARDQLIEDRDLLELELSALEDLDIFAAKMSKDGVWRWATCGKGYIPEDESFGNDVGLSITVGKGENAYVGGLFNDLCWLGGISMTTPGTLSNGFIASLDPTGLWGGIEAWIIGEPIEIIPEAYDPLTGATRGRPFSVKNSKDEESPLSILYVEDEDDPTLNKLYFVEQGIFQVYWKDELYGTLKPECDWSHPPYRCLEEGDPRLEFYDPDDPGAAEYYLDGIKQYGVAVWPSEPQIHIAGTKVDLIPVENATPELPPLQYFALHTMAHDTLVVANVFGAYAFHSDQNRHPNEPYAVVVYTRNNQISELEVIKTIPWWEAPVQDKTSCEIGIPITDIDHDDPSEKNGYVYNVKSRIDAAGADAAYNRTERMGAIIPVNTNTNPADQQAPFNDPQGKQVRFMDEDILEDDLVVVWYALNDLGVSWSNKAVLYQAEWPSTSDKFYRAEQDGSSRIPLVREGLGSVYDAFVVDLIINTETVHTVYFSDNGESRIRRVEVNDNNTPGVPEDDTLSLPQTIANSGDGLKAPRGLAVDTSAETYYFVDTLTGKIQRGNLDSSPANLNESDLLEDILTSLDQPYDVAVDPRTDVDYRLYFTEVGSQKISRSTLDGTGRVHTQRFLDYINAHDDGVFGNGLEIPEDVAVYDLDALAIEGFSYEFLIGNASALNDLLLLMGRDESVSYNITEQDTPGFLQTLFEQWGNGDPIDGELLNILLEINDRGDTVVTWRIDTGGVESDVLTYITGTQDLIVSDLDSPMFLAFDRNPPDPDNPKMYWLDYGHQHIQSSLVLDNGQILDSVLTLVTEGIDGPSGLLVNNEQIYWSDSNADKIYTANPDMSVLLDSTQGINAPRGLTMDDYGKLFWVNSGIERMVIASQLGSEVLDQKRLDPLQFPEMRIYNQLDRSLAGFNPNNEHADFFPSNNGSGFDAIFPLRHDLDDVSEPYVLVKHRAENGVDWQFRVYQVLATGFGYKFDYSGVAGKQIFAPYPLSIIQGAQRSYKARKDWVAPYWEDYKGGVWATTDGDTEISYHYPLQAGFYWDSDNIPIYTANTFAGGVPWLDRLAPASSLLEDADTKAYPIKYKISWPAYTPSLLLGETLISSKRGLPDLKYQAATQVVSEKVDYSLNAQDPQALVRLIDPLSPITVGLSDFGLYSLPGDLAVENDGANKIIVGNASGTMKLPFHLRTRLSYNPNLNELSFSGYLNENLSGEPLLLVNIMTSDERDDIKAMSGDSGFDDLIDKIYHTSRNPNQLDLVWEMNFPIFNPVPDNLYLVGMQYQDSDPNTPGIQPVLTLQTTFPFSFKAETEGQNNLGVPTALTAGAGTNTGYVTLAFNNDPSLNPLPVSLFVMRVDCLEYQPGHFSPYVGEIKVIESDNLFDEQLTLRHSGDFAGKASDLNLNFEWFYHPDEGGVSPDPPLFDIDGNLMPGSGWRLFDQGEGMVDITIEGANVLTLSDNWFFVRYTGFPACNNSTEFTQLAGDPSGTVVNPRAMLAEGWIKRVLRSLNPFETRVKDFHLGPTNTMANMLSQLGQRYEGPIALNSDPQNLNSIGLIEAYETILQRGMDLSINATPPLNYGPANAALLLVASRISDFYMLIGNEAFADSIDPTIGYGSDSIEFGTRASSIFSFMNQLDSLLEEELYLLHGRDDLTGGVAANPVYNRLYWNFTSGDGEVAYQQSYNISDQNSSGIIDETDARIMFPQGHGDAWGHYLTSMTTYHKLLRHPFYAWDPRAEAVLVSGVPVQVDFLDERKFAKAAAAKAKVGSKIVDLTYRKSYTEETNNQLEGFRDSNTERAWGLAGWGARAGQGAYFDWVVGNSLLPSRDLDPEHRGISKIDRHTVTELHQIHYEYKSVQQQVDEGNKGQNPLGLAMGVVPFDINPNLIDPVDIYAQTHFEQIAERAKKALQNAVVVFDRANEMTQNLRRNQDTVDDFTSNAIDQERDYRNRLIEIFGYPYSGDIGPGKLYPTGYDGPDFFHFMLYNEPSFLIQDDPELYIETSLAVLDIDNAIAGNSVEVDYFIPESGMGLVGVGEEYGSRRAMGSIQYVIGDLVGHQGQLRQLLVQYHNLIQAINDEIGLLAAQSAIAVLNFATLAIQGIANVLLDAAILVAHGFALVADAAAEAILQLTDAGKTAWPKNIICGVSCGGDALAPAAGATVAVGLQVWMLPKGIAIGSELTEMFLEDLKSINDHNAGMVMQTAADGFGIAERAIALAQLIREEAVLRLELHLMQGDIENDVDVYHTTMAEGERLVEDMLTYRRNTASQTQEYRYQDMTFRIFRNDALQKYNAQYDLAARYIYMAAKAYDYETNLVGSAPGSGNDFLADIVKQRQLGEIEDEEPVVGSFGLADLLGRMIQNYEVYYTQMGFNNPQNETNRFSLRYEAFRMLGDPVAWQNKLSSYRVDDLWNVPEYRQYCRPLAAPEGGPQPGLVIPLSTTVTNGLNFFGWPLAPGDNSYDSTQFATKIRSVGCWFADYDTSGLSNTPRVYLIPTGMDVLRSTNGDDFETRLWKVKDQKVPVPFPITNDDLEDDSWIPQMDSFSEDLSGIRRHSMFRAFHDSGEFDEEEIIADSRLVGRSVWNTQWVLIIPGTTMLANGDDALDTFIQEVTDIKLFFQTYAYSGARKTEQTPVESGGSHEESK